MSLLFGRTITVFVVASLLANDLAQGGQTLATGSPGRKHQGATMGFFQEQSFSQRLLNVGIHSGATVIEYQSIRLTEREVAVLTGVSHGLSNKRIATGLFIAEITVKSHIHTARAKFARACEAVGKRAQLGEAFNRWLAAISHEPAAGMVKRRSLTLYQASILNRFAQGWNYREIGERLFTSENNIKTRLRIALRNAEIAGHERPERIREIYLKGGIAPPLPEGFLQALRQVVEGLPNDHQERDIMAAAIEGATSYKAIAQQLNQKVQCVLAAETLENYAGTYLTPYLRAVSGFSEAFFEYKIDIWLAAAILAANPADSSPRGRDSRERLTDPAA